MFSSGWNDVATGTGPACRGPARDLSKSGGGQEYMLYRKVFLEHYRTVHRKDRFDAFESAYHIYTALDFLAFSIKTGNREMENRLKNDLDGLVIS